MALELYKDDAMTLPIKQLEVFSTEGETNFLLQTLAGVDVQDVFKWDGFMYNQLLQGTDYSIQSDTIVLDVALAVGENIAVLPLDNLDIVFTGPEAGIRVQTKKLVLHKTGPYIYDGLMLYSEDLTVEPKYFLETIVSSGYYTVGVDASFNIYDKGGVLITEGVGVVGFTSVLNGDAYYDCGLLINDYYIGDCIGNNATTIVLAAGTVVPTAVFTVDKIELLGSGNLAYAIDTNGTIPADAAFKKFLSIPALTSAEPTQKIWLRETAVIPGFTTITPNMPFKIMGQEYPE